LLSVGLPGGLPLFPQCRLGEVAAMYRQMLDRSAGRTHFRPTQHAAFRKCFSVDVHHGVVMSVWLPGG
ncbi:MAG: hypothetical protein ACF8TS_05380, partial [Maioricimonas sp. JB049]